MRESFLPVYNPPIEVFTHGKGMYLYTDKGVEYLDFVAGIAVNSLGYANEYLLKALRKQSEKLWHLSNMFRIEAGEKLADRLVEKTFADKVFFANSGAEANEVAFKIIRRYQFDLGKPDKYRIICMKNSFHGRTIATIAASGNPNYIKGFIPDDQGYDQVDFGDIEALVNVIDERTAGVVLEPIQGEGGVKVADKEYLQQIRKICDEKGIVLMFDEVQCGIARTGFLYAYQHFGVAPDVLTTAKGLGGGFPIGACLVKDKFGKCMVVGTHGSTFGGNSLATAIGNAVLDIVDTPEFLSAVKHNSEYMIGKLNKLVKDYPSVYQEESGLGLMLGLKVTPPNTDIVKKMREEHHILIAKAGNNTLRFLPPLIVEKEHIDKLAQALEQIGREYS